MRAALLLSVLVGAACGPKAGTPAADGVGDGVGDDKVISGKWDDGLVDGLLGGVKTAAGCPSATSKHRLWCIAADGWASGKAADLPAGPTLLVGLTLSLAEGDDIEDWLENGVHMSALGMRTEAGKTLIRIAPLVPSSEDEVALIKPSVDAVRSVLEAESAEADLPQDLLDYLADLPAAANRELVQSAHGWRFQAAGAGELRKVGAFWIAVEVPPDGPRGILLSIFTAAIKK